MLKWAQLSQGFDVANLQSCTNLALSQIEEVPITQEQYQSVLDIQMTVLEMLATQQDGYVIMDKLCVLAEALLPNAVATVMLLDEHGLLNIKAAPSVPDEGKQALMSLKPGPGGGSCGNAVYRSEPQYVINTFEDERWSDLRQLAVDFNLCSCWSMPIKDHTGKILGSFALSSFEHRAPSSFHKKLLETGANIVSIILENNKKNNRIKLFSNAMQSAVEGIVITDKNNKILEVNQTFKDVYKCTEEDVIGQDPKILSSKQQSKEFYEKMWHEIKTHSRWAGEIVNKNFEGEDVHQWLSISALKDKDGEIINYIALFSDITELKRAQKKLQHIAYYDPITSLKNKTALTQDLQSNQQDKTLLLLNVNDFSFINASYGYDVGDEILHEIADVLAYNFGKHGTYRVDSDVFALLYDADVDIHNIVTQIQQLFHTATIVAKHASLHVSFTFGAVTGYKNLLRDAALALKQAKENGKNTLYILEQDEHNSDVERHQQSFIEANRLIHMALLEDRIVPYFQGIRDNKTGKITKFESLVRINDYGTIVSPYKFLDTAKSSGLLSNITQVMIRKTFAIMQDKDCTFSINITEDDLNKNYLFEYLKEEAHRYDISPSRVILEILEGVSASGKANNIAQLKELKNYGFLIAIDDFGSEYSNFERVLDLDVDFLKIDARYIKNIDKDQKSFEITRAISFFAKNVHIPVVAEFVHSQEVQAKIDELGIEFSQGYLFSEPSPTLPEVI